MDPDTAVPNVSRRQLLAALGVGGSVAGASLLLDDDPEPAETSETDPDDARRLAEAYAPTLYFGKRERWFPTDPRRYASDRDGETVVDGFDALDGYTAEFRDDGSPPRPTAFYHAVDYAESSLTCVQFWFYAAFDQFSTNFHWHDWEVLHVFVDRDAGEGGQTASTDTADGSADRTGSPVLFVASAHSEMVPNNEYLDPETDRAVIISEVGSHSSTLGVNASPSTFQRTRIDDLSPDISNSPVEVLSGRDSLPLAYGLPRDEGVRLPYAVPELDGDPLPDLDRLPNVRTEDLLPSDLTVESFANLATPPEDIPARESATRFVPEARADASTATDDDVAYELVDVADVSHIAEFTGPQLSFTFRVPTYAEDALGEHITAPAPPWEQARFSNPEADVTDPRHREALADRYSPIEAGGATSRVLGIVREAVDAEDAPGTNGVDLVSPSVELVAVLESESSAVPTFGGVVALQDPPTGDHRLTVNGAGVAPYSETLTVEDGDVTGGGDRLLGVDGRIPTAANEDAVKLRGETSDGTALDGVTLDDDFAGRLYDGRPPGEDGRFGVYAHRSGAYTAEFRDGKGERGAVRLNPNADDDEVVADALETGKAALADYLVRFLAETREQTSVFEDGNSAGIDEVPTGRDVTDPVVNRASERAKANVDNSGGEGGGDNPGNGKGTHTEGRSETATDGSGTSTPTDASSSPPDETGDTDSTERGAGFDPGKGFTGLLKSFDAALLAAVSARDAASEGTASKADKRLQTVRKRLQNAGNVVDTSDDLPRGLSRLSENRVERMLPRVEAALDADD